MSMASAKDNSELIESGLNKLQSTLSMLEKSEDKEQKECEEEESNGDKGYKAFRKNRELIDLGESQILTSRLRSDSGRVYSSSMVVDSAIEVQNNLPTVDEEAQEVQGEIDELSKMVKPCSVGECCKNTATIVNMISKLQESVDEIKSTTNRQAIANSNMDLRIEAVQRKAKKNTTSIREIEDELVDYKFQLKLVSNVVIRQDEQIKHLNKKILEMQQREMYPNLVISGILENPAENTIQQYNKFIQNGLEIQELIPVHRAYRVGSGTNRPMIVELRDPIANKSKIYANVGKLKGKTNAKGGSYFVSDYLPEEPNDARRRANELFAENKKKPMDEKLKMTFKKGRLLINETPYMKAVVPPTPADILKPDEAKFNLADEIDMIKGEEETHGNSYFVAYAAAVKDHRDINAAYAKVRMKYANATHIVCAYRLPGRDSPNLQDYVDDGEIGAGRAILSVLKEQALMNIVIFMIRFYGGQNLGAQRFDVFKSTTRSAIKALQAKVKSVQEEEARKAAERERQQQQQQHTGWTDDEDDGQIQENWDDVQKKTK